MKLLVAGKIDRVLYAVNSGNIDITPGLMNRMLEISDKRFSSTILQIGLNDDNPDIREIASEHLSKAKEGAIGADFTDISIQDVQKIKNDVPLFHNLLLHRQT